MKRILWFTITSNLVAFWGFFACCAFGEPSANDTTTVNNSEAPRPAGGTTFYLKCRADNDLYFTLENSGFRCRRFSTPEETIEKTPEGVPILLLSDDYPTTPQYISASLFEKALLKKQRLYIEFCSSIPEMKTEEIRHAQWERCVVTTDALENNIPEYNILMLNDCYFLPITNSPNVILTLAKVAGYDQAMYGLPEQRFPVLFEIENKNLIVATSKLSNFITARHAPSKDWKIIWKYILSSLAPNNDYSRFDWTPDVLPCYTRDESLPENFEKSSFDSAVEWFYKSKLLIHESRVQFIHDNLKKNIETAPLPEGDVPGGDGSLGFCEGFSSPIKHDGSQMQRLPIRTDCNAEAAMIFALDWLLNKKRESRDVSRNLLDYIYFTSNIQGDVRGDPQHPAYGLIAWGTISPAWEVATYGDDEARVMLGTLAAAVSLESPAWNTSVLKGLLANLRTTGPAGFRGSRIDITALAQNGWRHYRDTERVFYSPHYESFLWACNLWAYAHTRYKPFLEKTRRGIRTMMEGYPDQWIWQDNIEKARMLLCLSWLIRVEDTPEHRQWLERIFNDLREYQVECGAIREKLPRGHSGYLPPTSNEAYGTSEAPLIQEDGDPCTDQLYTTGFALLGLHEAFAATGDQRIKQAEDKLVEYLCRIQTRSKKHSFLNGSWFRSFDYDKWECWASSGDVGWGAWCVESGWGQAWIGAILALRQLDTSLWDFTAKTDLSKEFHVVLQSVPQE